MNIYYKTLSGEIETLTFFEKQVTMEMVEKTLYKKNYKVSVFRIEDDEDKKEDKKDEDKNILFDGDMVHVFYEKQDFSPEENMRFETNLSRKINFLPELKDALLRFGAIVAGGSVLSTFGDYQIKDLDIYIHYSKAYEFILFLSKYCYSDNIHSAPAYDESFFRKNHIIGRILMCSLYRNFGRLCVTPIDLMIIPDEIPLEKIVTNFDLTFCQVWWDGEKIHSNDIDDIYNKKGSLNKDYIKSYLSMNEFIINRISKYKKRGFKISIDMTSFSATDLLLDIDSSSNKKSISNCEEQWVLTKICDYAYQKIRQQEKSVLFFDFYPKDLTMESLIEMYGENVFFALAKKYYFDYCIYFEQKYRDAYIALFGKILDGENYDDDENDSIISRWIAEKVQKLQNINRIISTSRSDLFRRENAQHIQDVENANDNVEEFHQQINIHGNLVVHGDMVVNGNMAIGNPRQNDE